MRFTCAVVTESFLSEKWDAFVNICIGATLFHKKAFLDYHGVRFAEERRFIGIYKGQELFGLLPAALVATEGKRELKSPYGASYGGPIFRTIPTFSESSEIVAAIVNYAKENQADRVCFLFPPAIYYKQKCETFEFCLLASGFRVVSQDICSIAALNHLSLTSKTRNVVRKALGARPKLNTNAPIEDFWKVLESTYAKHGTNPTHSFKELDYLTKLPGNPITLDVAYLEDTPIAGICNFWLTPEISSSFYLAQDPVFQDRNALTALLDHNLTLLARQGLHYYDFGTSTSNMVGRSNIFLFKEGFGSIGRFRTTFVWEVV